MWSTSKTQVQAIFKYEVSELFLIIKIIKQKVFGEISEMFLFVSQPLKRHFCVSAWLKVKPWQAQFQQ